MIKYLLNIAFIVCLSFNGYSQDDGVVALDLPVRNSLRFNQHMINPTFSFVREQNKYISFTNKLEWTQFENAPQSYLFGYAGRFEENIGAGVTLFQQNYGVLTTFGGVANFAYNIVLNRESNLTFGMNLGIYNSGLNQGKVITNFPDPSLDNIPSNLVITINPGINYGIGFLDFGLSINNLVSYNFTNSQMIEDNPEQGIQIHGMYTGYFNSRGFFDESKFSALIRSEFKNDQTVISGLMMVTVPKGIWGQVGYNTLYGASAGLGLNISSQIAIEYNYEKALGDLSTLGHSHDITLAYRFKNNSRYDYNGDDDEKALLIPEKKKSNLAKRNRSSKPDPRKTAPKTSDNSAELAVAALLAKQNKEQEEKDKALALAESERLKAKQEAKLKEEEDKALALVEEQRLRAEQETQALALAETERLRAEEEAKLKEEEDKALALAEEQRLKAEQEAQALALAETERLKTEQEAKLKEEEDKALAQAEAQRLKAEQDALVIAEAERLKAEQDAQALLEEQEEVDEGVVPTDEATVLMNDITRETVESNKEQQELLTRLTEKVSLKQKDLDDLIIENDLSEQGIVSAPKAFRSVSAENRELEELTSNIDKVIKSQNDNIRRLDEVYKKRLKDVPNEQDPTNRFYKQKIKDLKSEQLKAIQLRQKSLIKIEQLKEDIKIEKKRRIKRALYDNEDDRYSKDRSDLNRIKQNTVLNSRTYSADDFDFGRTLSTIQIIKDVRNVESGYYLVVAVHSDINKRDEFIRKAIEAGESNIDFFYDVNSSNYYIYYEKHNNISDAQNTMSSKGSKPYNGNMSMVKIEN
ncbi:PorP/SprF family type IX secretion system membrane protein [uncultured Algibacter sp.]|uniref:PorP/SprF family type IX secretion system membrane protein n=1 Tax=uncultured Algibacter sp. TaxID=298659 RepID=UPI002616AE8C|nr:PorP/SprF family type IX secretion system membrane protein [uncultured Algibacter sp.]